MKKALCILLTTFVLLSACSIKKRTYRNGYYIDWVHKGTKNTENSTQKMASTGSATNKKNAALPKTEVLQTTTEPNTDVASATNNVSEKIISPKKLLQLKDTCGDIINLRKGDIITAKVVEITETQIKYKRCDNIDGPLIVINKNDVYNVKYTNGYTDNFIKNSNINSNTGNYINKIEHPLVAKAVTWTALILYFGFFAALPAFIISRRAKNEILMNPNKFSGLETVTRCENVSKIYLIITVVLTLFVIAVVLLPLIL